ncbi:MAG: hypothetical protein JXQ72_01345 [Anaerolineae bacterium]|nr:hypothetical protein [Anaerolineae bacterium]
MSHVVPKLGTRSATIHTLTVLLYVVFAATYNVYVGTKVATDDLLAPRLYTTVLEDTDIYHRVYSELLADPQLQDVTTQLLGNIKVSAKDWQSVYSYSVSTLRLVLPPQVIQRAVETVIEELIAYLAGRRDRLDADLDLSRAVYDSNLSKDILTGLESLKADLIARSYARGVIINEDPVLTHRLYPALEQYMRALARGEIDEPPVELITTSLDSLSAEEKKQIAEVLLRPLGSNVSETAHQQIEAALVANDLSSAIVIASDELVQPHVREAVDALRRQLKRGRLAGMGSLADLTHKPQEQIINELNDIRDLLRFLRRDLAPWTIGALAGSMIIQMRLHIRHMWHTLRVTGIMLALAGLSVLVSWLALRQWLNTPYAEIRHPGGWDLPPSLRMMLSDVLRALEHQLWQAVRARALIPLGMGGVLIGLSYIQPVFNGVFLTIIKPLALRPRLAIVLTALLVVILPLVTDWVLGDKPAHASMIIQCNGHAALCERPYNETVFAAAHNAMSISSKGWIWPSHDLTLTAQLELGVRALLIDTHYWDKTYQIEDYLATLPPAIQPTIETIIQARHDDAYMPQTRTFLCHSLCALGATSLNNGLTEIRRYMDRHPHEVITLIIQDGIAPADTVAAFEASGLIRYVYTHTPGAPWPTLGDLIERGERLIVLAEASGPPPDWYHYAWDYLEETPFTYRHPDQFDCVPERGGTEKPLFLLNHWIARDSPSRVDAARVNDYDFLLSRAQQCAGERGQLPNFIAVNFVSIGDVFAVVDTLNGLHE